MSLTLQHVKPRTPDHKQAALQFLDELKKAGRFGPEAYKKIDVFIRNLAQQHKMNRVDDADIDFINSYYGKTFLENTLQGSGLLKKYGYAGDFLMIDQIYTGVKNEDPFYDSWNNYFMSHAAPKAVVNRKKYFKDLVLSKMESARGQLSILNIASGPARDIKELLDIANDYPVELKIVCVESSAEAIDYAKNVTKGYEEQVQYINKNAFRFSTDNKFDLVWSAGLFDYFDHRAFLHLLKKCKTWARGEIVVGNFNADHNPSRDFMELFGRWYLHHRRKEELTELAKEAGFGEQQIRIRWEAEEVNLFLHVTT